MACTTQSMIPANSCVLPSQRFLGRNPHRAKCGSTRIFFSATASSASPDESDCNDEECAPDKEVGKVSVDWLAAERTKVVGTFPPRNRGWTGYIEKDTAGQTNIYSVEPAVYVADSVISSGTAGTSADGAGNTLAVTGVLALVSIAAASTILIQVGKNQPPVPTVDYSGPPLGYYINKFKSVTIVEASVRPAPQTSSTVQASVPLEFSGSSSVEASIAPQSQIANAQEARKQEVVPEVEVGLREAVVDARSTSASIVS